MNTQAYQNLANEIIIKAAKDYRAALRRQARNPDSLKAKHDIHEIERFFRSEWFSYLTEISGEYFIRRLREEVGA